MSFTIGKVRLEDLVSEDEEDESYAGEEDVKQSSESSDEDDRAENPTKKRKIEHDEIKEKEKVLSLVDDFWASMKEPESTPTVSTTTISKTSSITSTLAKPQIITSTSQILSTTSLFETNKETEKETVEEVKTFKFAGELIQLTAKEAESVGAKPKVAKKGAAAPNNNMSSLLDSLKGKKKITTIQKSTLDWGKFKKDQKLEDELEQQRKDGYLEKQAFLQRADSRQFEVERGARLKERQVNYKKSINS
jgi:hypothetical protein